MTDRESVLRESWPQGVPRKATADGLRIERETYQ